MFWRTLIALCVTLWSAGSALYGASRSDEGVVPGSVLCARGASFAERLAAREIRRYLYLRTGKLLPLRDRLDH